MCFCVDTWSTPTLSIVSFCLQNPWAYVCVCVNDMSDTCLHFFLHFMQIRPTPCLHFPLLTWAPSLCLSASTWMISRSCRHSTETTARYVFSQHHSFFYYTFHYLRKVNTYINYEWWLGDSLRQYEYKQGTLSPYLCLRQFEATLAVTSITHSILPLTVCGQVALWLM